MARRITAIGMALAACSLVLPLAFAAQSRNRTADIRGLDGGGGGVYASSNADPREVGLPIYPGAQIKHDADHESDSSASLDVFTTMFGIRLVVLNYTSDDSADKIVNYYRDKLKKYGKVIECHYSEQNPEVKPEKDGDSSSSSEVKCLGDNKGNNIELKVGTEDNQHAVAIQPNKSGGATFALVYVHVRGKQADI